MLPSSTFAAALPEFVALCSRHGVGPEWTLHRTADGVVSHATASAACELALPEDDGVADGELVFDAVEDAAALPTARPPALLELHIVHDDTFGVPALLMRASTPAGSPASHTAFLGAIAARLCTPVDALGVLVTQVEHPVTGTPYYALHPCRTADRMRAAGAPPGPRYLFTWWVQCAVDCGVRLAPLAVASAAGDLGAK